MNEFGSSYFEPNEAVLFDCFLELLESTKPRQQEVEKRKTGKMRADAQSFVSGNIPVNLVLAGVKTSSLLRVCFYIFENASSKF